MLPELAVELTRQADDCLFVAYVGLAQATGSHAPYRNVGADYCHFAAHRRCGKGGGYTC